jgi:hypothetical protein
MQCSAMGEGISSYVSGSDSLQKSPLVPRYQCGYLSITAPRAAQRRNSWQDVIGGHQWLPVAPLGKCSVVDQMVRRLVGNKVGICIIATLLKRGKRQCCVCTSSLRHMLLGPASYARRASQPSLSAQQHTSACHHDFASSLVLLLIFTPRISCRPICRLISFA